MPGFVNDTPHDHLSHHGVPENSSQWSRHRRPLGGAAGGLCVTPSVVTSFGVTSEGVTSSHRLNPSTATVSALSSGQASTSGSSGSS